MNVLRIWPGVLNTAQTPTVAIPALVVRAIIYQMMAIPVIVSVHIPQYSL